MGQNNNNYSHFAVNKETNLIVNGWDYNGYDGSELRQFKKDYFEDDLRDYGFNPKEYKILTLRGCEKYGIDPNDDTQWSNDGLSANNGGDIESIVKECTINVIKEILGKK